MNFDVGKRSPLVFESQITDLCESRTFDHFTFLFSSPPFSCVYSGNSGMQCLSFIVSRPGYASGRAHFQRGKQHGRHLVDFWRVADALLYEIWILVVTHLTLVSYFGLLFGIHESDTLNTVKGQASGIGHLNI